MCSRRCIGAGSLCGTIHVSGTFSPRRIIAQYAECFSIAWNVNGLLSRYTSSISAHFLIHSRARSYHQPRRSMTNSYRGLTKIERLVHDPLGPEDVPLAAV